jgi:RimJ/RimL family protein N-acetyltransferase
MKVNFWSGKKIRLRAIEPEDHTFFYEWNQETETARNIDWLWFPTSRASQQEWASKESLKKGANDEYFFVIETLQGVPVGSINTNTVNRIDGTFRYGIGIIEQERGKGYAKEAVKILLDYYFNELRYHKVNVTMYAFNKNSIRLHEQLGFVEEGRLRQAKYTRGQYWDVLIYGMLSVEYNEKRV